MPVNFTCPHCGAQTTVADQFVGRTGACASCGQPITVHGAPGAAVAVAPATSSAPMIAIILGVVCVVLLVCGGLLALLLLPAVQAAREAGRKTMCRSNLAQIGMALHNYNSQYGCFPPAYIPDENGQPKYSWRVLILPQLGRQDLYEQYDFDEPWNSSANAHLADKIPAVYLCLTDSDLASNTTSYVAAVGPDRMFPGADARKFNEVTDGLSNTIAVMEYSDSGIGWLEPRDGPAPGDPTAVPPPRSEHTRGWHVLMGDASVQFIPDSTDPQTVEGMMTVDGGEPVTLP
jgi:type II secretory pathway pseudopilin PulG